MSGLLSVKEAQNRILSFFQPTSVESVPVAACARRILTEDVHAPDDLPQFTNSSMDGFAVRSIDVRSAAREHPAVLTVIADIPAGSAGQVALNPGQAARIMTGAPLPAGADAVAPVEDTDFAPGLTDDLEGNQLPSEVRIYQAVDTGAYVRPRGQDVRQGQVLLQKGRKLQPQDAGILASIGQANVSVYRRPRVALFSSGDELVPPGQPLGRGQIYDSNGFVLAALLEREGAQVIHLGTAPDDPRQIESLLRRAVDAQVDLIVTSAGVSVGAFDYVRRVIEANGKLEFWKVNMRPGKPLAFGAFSGIPLVGLPGNPVSAYVGCRVFVLPAVQLLSGRDPSAAARRLAVLAEPVDSDGRESYLRAVVREDGGQLVARLTGHQGSGNLFSLVQANALLIVPSGVKSVPSGTEVEIWLLDE